jgi:LuxR family maltose regulon positive regulatory protein
MEKKDIVNTKFSVDILAGLSLTFQLLGRTDQAMTILGQLAEFTERQSEPNHINVAESCHARILILQGESSRAIQWARSFTAEPHIPSMNFWLEIPQITKARVLIAEGTDDEIDKALQSLKSMNKQIAKLHNTYQKIEILVLQSVALNKLGCTTEALTSLEEVIYLAMPGGWIRPFVEAGSMMIELLERLEEKDDTREYITILTDALEKQQAITVSGIQADSDLKLPPITAASSAGKGEHFTTRELEVLNLLAKGYRNKEMAAELFLSPETVKRHLYNIFQKLNVNNRMQAISRAGEMGLIG